jgi:hypothetical protein
VAVYVFFFDILPMFPQHLGQMGGKREKNFFHSNFNIEKKPENEVEHRIARRSKFGKKNYILTY